MPRSVRPSWWLVLLPGAGPLIAALVLLLAFAVLGRVLGQRHDLLAWSALVILLAGMVHALLWKLTARYDMDAQRLSSRMGILNRVRHEVALTHVRSITLRQSLVQRLTGTGTMEATAADGLPVIWPWVPDAAALLQRVREAHQRALARPSREDPTMARVSSEPLARDDSSGPPPFVLGLVGGIGAGKSAVAAALGRRNFLVIDADADAKAALRRPEVRQRLLEWWGPEVLDADGSIDRKRVGAIVFGQPQERQRLEGLIHPLIKADRAGVIARARAEGRTGVVIDAPLLFEAGSDKECDAVLFVDAPREQRLARVKARGWDEAELTRRENAQLPLEQKRSRAHAVVRNDGSMEALEASVAKALEEVRVRRRDGQGA